MRDDATPVEIRRLRWQLYNATLEHVRRVHEDLAILRVRGDAGAPAVEAGQYTLLGLGNWERRVDDVAPPAKAAGRRASLVRRPYSVSCPLLDEQGDLVRIEDRDWLEFYLALIRKPVDDPPSLTLRLFALAQGDRLFLGSHAKGRYTLQPVGPDDDVILCATGTGEAPHNAMLAELLGRGHRGRIVSAVSVRRRRDLAYLDVHRRLERRYANYRYVPLTTQEPENLDPDRPGYAGKLHLQDVFGDEERCRERIGFVPRPGKSRFFLCGNPAMIGLPVPTEDGSEVFPQPPGMAEVLTGRGFRLARTHTSGDVHFEKYW